MRNYLCPTCKGKGFIYFNPHYPDPQTDETESCRTCNEAGTITEEEYLQLKLGA